MGDEEVLKFSVTEDDLEDEFNPTRFRHKLTKNQQIYGIWADEEDNSDDEGSSHPSFAKNTRKSYTTPLNFVSGGLQKPADSKCKNESNEKEVIEVSDECDSSGDEIGKKFAKEKKHQRSKKAMHIDMGEMAGFRTTTGFKKDTTLMDRGVGDWEKHTKGIGAKLLLQMGFQPGKGLGKSLQGINAPIEAQLRKGRGAIGAYGSEKKTKLKYEKEAGNDVEEGDEEGPSRMSQWRKGSGDQKKKKVHYVYKTAEDVTLDGKKANRKIEMSELSKVKVIDMTGPEQRVLSGYHAISGVKKPDEEWALRKDKKFSNFAMPELLHNLNLLVDLAEDSILENNQKLKHCENQKIILENQEKSLEASIKRDRRIIDNVDDLLKDVEQVMKELEENSLTLDKATEIFCTIKKKHPSEFVSCEIALIAIHAIKPLLKSFLAEGYLLTDSSKCVSTYETWRNILNVGYANTGQDTYKKLVYDTLVPAIHVTTSFWDCRNYAPMIEFISTWTAVIPVDILESILTDIIMIRIQREVELWDPMTDPVPIHSWIHPWINYIGDKFECVVYPLIRQKISRALVNWHPSDSSARLMLRPWMGVFDEGEMDAFLVNNILPKLVICLQSLVIDPHQQHLDYWNWTMEWSEMIPAHTMALVLENHFFPQWLSVLDMWLRMPDVDFTEVGKWYSGWKSLMPPALANNATVKDYLCAALKTMNRAVGGQPTVLVDAQPTREEKMVEAINTASQIPEGFKDLVQKRCEAKGILWVPLPNKYVHSKPVYRCGSYQVYIDRNVLFANSGLGGLFVPISLNELLELAADDS